MGENVFVIVGDTGYCICFISRGTCALKIVVEKMRVALFVGVMLTPFSTTAR